MVHAAASDMRRRSRQITGPRISTSRVIKACLPGTLVAGGKLPKGVLGVASRTPQGNVIIYARFLSTPEQRHVIAHEIGHLLFDHDETSAARPGKPGDPKAEARADLFADELLAPLHIVARHVRHVPSADPDYQDIFLDHVDEIASKFQVPSAVIARRIDALTRLMLFD